MERCSGLHGFLCVRFVITAVAAKGARDILKPLQGPCGARRVQGLSSLPMVPLRRGGRQSADVLVCVSPNCPQQRRGQLTQAGHSQLPGQEMVSNLNIGLSAEWVNGGSGWDEAEADKKSDRRGQRHHRAERRCHEDPSGGLREIQRGQALRSQDWWEQRPGTHPGGRISRQQVSVAG